jgi:cell division protein FtsL
LNPPAAAREIAAADDVPAGSRPSAARAAAAAVLAGKAAPSHARPARSPRARHLRVVDQAPRFEWLRGPKRARAMMLIAAGIVTVIAFALVYMHVVLAQRQFALDRMTSRVQAEQTQYQQLRLRVAQLESPANIISTAEGQLGMKQPGSVTYLTPTSQVAVRSSTAVGSGAPAGNSDWPQIKSQLAGSP